MRARKDIVVREIAGEYILIPTGEASLRIQGMGTITSSGYRLWQELCEKDCSEDDLVRLLREEYEVDESTAKSDVREFVQSIRQYGLLE